MGKSVVSGQGLEGNNVLHSIIWHQGEADTDYGSAGDQDSSALSNLQYTAYMKDLVQGFRSSVQGANSKTPFINGGMSPPWRNNGCPAANYDPIETAIEGISSQINYTGTASSQGLVGGPQFGPVHFDAASMHTFGDRFWSAYQSIVNLN
jgi:hypothetical protein